MKTMNCIFLLPSLGVLWAAEPINVAMTPDHWDTSVQFQKHKGIAAMELKNGQAILNDVTFRDGTIEFDVDPQGQMGAGIGFRRRDDNTYEDFYIRPKANCSQALDCIQYAPQTHGTLLWDLFPQYQAPAPIRVGEWNHVKLVVSGSRLNVFVNEEKSPSLRVGRLEGDALEGGLLLQGPGFFANLTITPDAVDGLTPEAAEDQTASDRRFARNWRITEPQPLPSGKEIAFTDFPGAPASWGPLKPERGGLINISREYGRQPGRSVVWLKTTIHSSAAQQKHASIGWAREVWVFVNGKLAYADKNLYQPPAARKTPDGRCSIENGSFSLPLSAGDNEIDVALADDFYGWGLILRLDDMNQLQW